MAVTVGAGGSQMAPDDQAALDQGREDRTTTSGHTHGGGSTSTSTPDPDYEGPGLDYNDTDTAARFLGVGGHPEVWKDSTTGQIFLVYFAQGTDPPIPLLYEVPDDGITLQAFFGEGKKIVFDNTFTGEEMKSTGAIRFGTTNNLDASEGDPWVGFKDRMERAALVTPWLQDDEILALVGGAYLEGRELQDWELEGTDWYQEHNEAERSWLKLALADPATALKRIEDYKITTAALFDKIGADGTDPALIEWMSNKYVTGAWSLAKLTEQVEAVTSGWSEVDPDLEEWLSSSDIELETTKSGFEAVRELYNKWLGPAYPPSDEDLQRWATKIRKSGDGLEELTAMLRGQRLAMYPGYEDENLTYQDIAGPYKNLGQNVWGQKMDETSDMFQQMLQMNDYTEASALLRKEGLSQDIEKVWKDSTESFRQDRSDKTRSAV